MHIAIENLKCFFYFEPSSFLFIGRIGSFKFRSISSLFYELKDGFVRASQSILFIMYMYIMHIRFNVTLACQIMGVFTLFNDCMLRLVKNSVFSINNLFLKAFISVVNGWNIKLRFVGIGYKMYFSRNLIVYKLGYSHFVVYLLPYELSLMFIGRKRRSFIMFCLNSRTLSLVIRSIIYLRIPNVYTGKGIRLRGVLFSRKEGKKSQF